MQTISISAFPQEAVTTGFTFLYRESRVNLEAPEETLAALAFGNQVIGNEGNRNHGE